jgi:hypothetical protein
MADTESLRQVVHSRAPLSTWLGIVLLFALFGVIVLAVIGPAPRGSDYEETRAKKRVELLKTSREEATKALTTYGWIDKNKGVARIPIERAMELTVAELAQQKPAPAGPIAAPEPQAQPAASPSPAQASPAPAGAAQLSAAQPVASPSGQAPTTASSPARTSPSPATQPSPIPPSPAPSNTP